LARAQSDFKRDALASPALKGVCDHRTKGMVLGGRKSIGMLTASQVWLTLSQLNGGVNVFY
jgi:hypothetical protein